MRSQEASVTVTGRAGCDCKRVSTISGLPAVWCDGVAEQDSDHDKEEEAGPETWQTESCPKEAKAELH